MLNDTAEEHLREILTGAADGFDPRCLECQQICKGLNIKPADAVLLVPATDRRADA